MHVADILKIKGSRVISADTTDSIKAALSSLHKNQIGALVVLDAESNVAGILSERDIVRGLAEQGVEILSLKVNDLMSRRLYVCAPGDSIKDVMVWMTNQRIRHLPVVEDGQLRGLISIGDVVKHRLSEVQTEANVLRDIVTASR